MTNLAITKHPIYYRDEELNHFISKNFQTIYNNTGTDDLSVAIKVANLVIFGERHRSSDRQLHNALLEKIVNPLVPIFVEERSDKVFIPQGKLPGQLQFFDTKRAGKLNLHGWDDPVVIDVLEEAIDDQLKELDTFLRKTEMYEQENHQQILKFVDHLLTIAPEQITEQPKVIESIIFPCIRHSIDSAKKGRELSSIRVSMFLKDISKISMAVVMNEECWFLRTESLVRTAVRALNCFKQAIFIGGKAHFNPKSSLPSPEKLQGYISKFYQRFEEIFKDQKVLILFTPQDLQEKNDNELDQWGQNPDFATLEEYIISTRIRIACQNEIKRIIESGASTLEILDRLQRWRKTQSTPQTNL